MVCRDLSAAPSMTGRPLVRGGGPRSYRVGSSGSPPLHGTFRDAEKARRTGMAAGSAGAMTPLLSKMTPREQSSHSVARLHAQRPSVLAQVFTELTTPNDGRWSVWGGEYSLRDPWSGRPIPRGSVLLPRSTGPAIKQAAVLPRTSVRRREAGASPIRVSPSGPALTRSGTRRAPRHAGSCRLRQPSTPWTLRDPRVVVAVRVASIRGPEPPGRLPAERHPTPSGHEPEHGRLVRAACRHAPDRLRVPET